MKKFVQDLSISSCHRYFDIQIRSILKQAKYGFIMP